MSNTGIIISIGCVVGGLTYAGLCITVTATILQTSGFYTANEIGINIIATIGIAGLSAVILPIGIKECIQSRRCR